MLMQEDSQDEILKSDAI